MKTIISVVVVTIACFFASGCSSSENSTTLKPANSHLAGTWTISDITVNIPSDRHVTNVFDEASYEDF